MKREDLHLEKAAVEKGWTVERHTLDEGEEVPKYPLSFKKENKFLWKTKKQWTCAEIDYNTISLYKNHRKYDSLEIALSEES